MLKVMELKAVNIRNS